MFLPLNIYMVVASQLLGVAADQVPTYDFGQNCHSIATLNNSIEPCANDEEDAHESSERYGLTFRPPTRRGVRP